MSAPTLAFDYGETPADVICDRIKVANPFVIVRKAHGPFAYVGDTDDLVTTLDALLIASRSFDEGGEGSRALRIALLASLGIEEA